MYNREKDIDEIFLDLKKESYEVFNLSSNIDSIIKKIIDKISLDLTIKSKMIYIQKCQKEL